MSIQYMYKMKILHLSITIISSMILIFSTNTIFAYDQTTTDYGGGLLRTIPSTYPSQITVNNQTMDYQIDGGTLKSVKFNPVLPALDITIDSTSGGIITLNIPRNLIDSKDRFANDAPFVVTKNGKEVLPVKEQWLDYSRAIILNFDQGTSVFEIVGTGVSHLTVPQMQPLIKIINPDPHTKDLFGSSIAAVNGTIIIGTPNAMSSNNTRGGVVYLFDGTGKHLLTISDPDDADGDQFGYAVTSLESKIVVGAPNAFSNGIQCGKVYLFDLQGRLLQTITDPDPHKQDLFGYSLAASQDRIIVGSPSHINNKIQSGSVYVFDSSGNKLLGMTNPDKENADLFGFSMVQIGNKIAVGAPNNNHGALQAGSVFVFDAKSGNLVLTLRNPSPDNRTDPNTGSDQFGFSLANANGLLVVGERGGDIKQIANGQVQYETDQSGNVRIYDITNDKMIQTIDDPHPVQNNNFGISVSAYGNKILIGMDHDDTQGYDAGSAFLYDINGNMIQEIQNPTPTPVTSETMGNYFGSSVLLLKNDMVIGSPGDNTGATNAGAVYMIQNNTISVTHPSLSTPLKQFKSGILASDVQCAQGLELVLKAEDGSPACVKFSTAESLIKHGWASSESGISSDGQRTYIIQDSSASSKTSIINNTSCNTPYLQSDSGMAVLYMPTNSTGKICVRYYNLNNTPAGVGIRIFEENNMTQNASDITTWASNSTLQGNENTTISYFIKTGNKAGFYGLSLFCGGMPFAVGYDANSTLVSSDFSGLEGIMHACPSQGYEYHIEGVEGIGIRYIHNSSNLP